MARIPIGKTGLEAIVDDADYERVSQHKWSPKYRSHTIYAVLSTNKSVMMHRFILDAQPGQSIDHKNHNGLDNRRENLRVCTTEENNQNRRLSPSRNKTGYVGVDFRDVCGKYRATITVNGRKLHLGHFETAEDAAKARDTAAKAYKGDFAFLNFKQEGLSEGVTQP